MTQVVRISLPGKDVFTSTDPNDFALFTDQDNILLKEKSRSNVSSGGSVVHDLGYIPFYLTYGDLGGGLFQLATGFDQISGIPRSKTSTTTLSTAGSDMKCFIFYDNMN